MRYIVSYMLNSHQSYTSSDLMSVTPWHLKNINNNSAIIVSVSIPFCCHRANVCLCPVQRWFAALHYRTWHKANYESMKPALSLPCHDLSNALHKTNNVNNTSVLSFHFISGCLWLEKVFLVGKKKIESFHSLHCTHRHCIPESKVQIRHDPILIQAHAPNGD